MLRCESELLPAIAVSLLLAAATFSSVARTQVPLLALVLVGHVTVNGFTQGFHGLKERLCVSSPRNLKSIVLPLATFKYFVTTISSRAPAYFGTCAHSNHTMLVLDTYYLHLRSSPSHRATLECREPASGLIAGHFHASPTSWAIAPIALTQCMPALVTVVQIHYWRASLPTFRRFDREFPPPTACRSEPHVLRVWMGSTPCQMPVFPGALCRINERPFLWEWCGVTVKLSTSEDAFAVPRPGGVKFSPDCKVGWGDMGARVWVASRANLNRRSSIIIVPDALHLIPDFSGQQKWSNQRTSTSHPPSSMSRTVNATTTPRRANKKKQPKLSKEEEERKKEAKRVASARYRERNREAVLQAGRERAARRRASLRALKPGHQDLEAACSRAREAGARYRAQNRESLVVKQRLVRKRAYIRKHGIYAHIQRRFDAPIHRDPEPESSGQEEEDDDDDAWGFGRPDLNYIAPRICDYDDPFLRH
ncbi:hypothetical protein K438DRAFT_1788288 [Mycena galopus ATCC 62051]|nr:hypothetical protein K438DRAFT_1788288 [Mycena galopus ATCC 62051]